MEQAGAGEVVVQQRGFADASCADDGTALHRAQAGDDVIDFGFAPNEFFRLRNRRANREGGFHRFSVGYSETIWIGGRGDFGGGNSMPL